MADSPLEATEGDHVGGSVATLSVEQAVELAVGLQKGGLLDAAEEIYQRVLAAVPDHVDGLHFLGLARYQRGDHEQSLALVSRAVALAPENADARNNLGNMLLEMGRIEDAEAAYRKVLELRPDHADSHTNVGTVLRRKGDMNGAEACFRRALALNPAQAEAYHNLGGLLQETHRAAEALTVYQRALELRPYDGESYRRMGMVLYAVGRVDEAAGMYQRWLTLEPDSAIAKHMVAACSGRDVPARASDAYVEGTFDKFAASFDTVLGRLNYRAPELCADAVAAAMGAPAARLDVLDAGAGTGLCGPSLRGYARRLTGIDLSPGMLAKAKERGSYDVLEVAELTAFMQAHRGAFDLIVSADTLVYFGDLAQALAAAAGALRIGGHLVFTVEHAADEPSAGFRIHPHGRYSHGEAYVRRVLSAAGLTPLAVAPAHLRVENQLRVDGLVVTARRG